MTLKNDVKKLIDDINELNTTYKKGLEMCYDGEPPVRGKSHPLHLQEIVIKLIDDAKKIWKDDEEIHELLNRIPY